MEEESKKISLLQRWKNRDATTVRSNPIIKSPSGIKIPLSYGQKRLWFLQQLYPENAFYNYSETYTFNGSLNESALVESFNGVFKDHDILRTTYHIDNGVIYQTINDATELNIEIHDLSSISANDSKIECQKIIESNANTYFELTSFPLIRATLIKLNPTTNILQITMHHIITDKWSMGKFRDDLASYYRELNLKQNVNEKRTAIQYTDYAYWQSKNEIDQNSLNYWKKKLSGDIPVLNLPTDYSRPLKPTFKGAASFIQIYSDSLSSKLLSLSKQLDTTPYVLMLSIYYVLLYRNSGQTDILVGSPVTNRNQKVLEDLIGFFNETIILRTTITPNSSFKNLVKSLRLHTIEAFENKSIPFDTLVKELNVERSLSLNPFFQVMFLYHSVPENPFFDTNLTLTHTWHDLKVSKFDLTLYISEENGILSSTFEYASDLFEEATINRFQDYFKSLIEAIVINPNQSISDIPMVSESERQILFNQNKPTYNSFDEFSGIHHIIEHISTLHPTQLAVTFNEHSITYKELNEKANQVAYALLKKSSQANIIVGLCIERSVEMIIGLLGILKAGCAYLPIDPDYPIKRIEFMLQDAKVDTIISHTTLSNLFEHQKVEPIFMDTIDYSDTTTAHKLPVVHESDLAYIIYTSGSTGQPKGVPITHKNIIQSTGGRLDFYDENPSAFLLLSSISFDSSKAGVFWTLCTGGNLVITEKRIEQDIEQIGNTIEQHNISHALMLPSLYQVIVEHIETTKLKSLTTVMVAGEACSKHLCETHFNIMPNVSLYNEYGPTEATVWCIAHKIENDDLAREHIPIGKPVANAQIYVLDADKNLAPFGVMGEIFVGGQGLSKGYYNRPDLTDKAFVENPFSTGEKLYKTGDLGTYRNDGTIEFGGRADQQIKIRGFRVELDEIENTINRSSLVQQAIILVKQDQGKPKKLIAYIKPNNTYDEEKLKLDLKKELPDYMIPTSFISIDAIPFLPNGKVDKKSLANIEAESRPNVISQIEKPLNDIEQQLLDIWKDILNITALSTTDNFFEVGGDSILSIQIIAKARKLGISIAPNQLFEHQTISELAMFVSLKNEANTINEAMVVGTVPLTPIQKWFFDTHKTAPNYWNQAFILKDLPDSINEKQLQDITNNCVETHDALRLSFHLENENWNATALKTEALEPFIVVDISNEIPLNYSKRIEDTLKEIQEHLKLEKGSLFKCIYFKTGTKSSNCVILLAHHLVIDFVSWQIILNGYTEVIYEGERINHDSKTASIKTWGDHLQNLASSKSIYNELDFWKKQVATKIELPKDSEGSLPIVEKDVSVISFKVDKQLTQNLIDSANNAYNTKIEELILTALIDTLSNWIRTKTIPIAMERHGRETINTTIELSNTVGWFTSFFPKLYDLESATDIESKIITTKEQMRQIPNGGIGYGILRYVNSSLDNFNFPEIVFNFLGKQNTNNKPIDFYSKSVRHPLSERHYYLEINALIKDGELIINWSYSNKIHKAETITTLIDDFNQSLKSIVAHCINSKDIKYTPSDFEDVDLNQNDLDSLMESLDL